MAKSQDQEPALPEEALLQKIKQILKGEDEQFCSSQSNSTELSAGTYYILEMTRGLIAFKDVHEDHKRQREDVLGETKP